MGERRFLVKNRREPNAVRGDVVRLGGLEPPRFPRQILSLLCMPIPPQPRMFYYTGCGAPRQPP